MQYGIYDIIMELSSKFHFDEFLFPGSKNIVFITSCMGIILLNNPTATHIAQKLT